MRSLCLSFLAMSAIWLTDGVAQESTDGIPDELLCDQCPFDAPVRIRRDDFFSPGATPVLTAEDMRKLGLVSVADMINQLPEESESDAAEKPEDSVSSGSNQNAESEETDPDSPEE